MKEINLLELIKKSSSKNEVLIKYYGYANKYTYDKLKKFIEDNNVDVSHFEKVIKYCLQCEEILDNNRKKFCNSSCAAKYNTKDRVLSDETKEKIRSKLIGRNLTFKHRVNLSKENNGRWKDGESRTFKFNNSCLLKEIDGRFEYIRKCVICNKEFKLEKKENGRVYRGKTCSTECHTQLASNVGKEMMQKRIENGEHNGWFTRNITSYPEKFFIEVLNNNGIKYEHNYPIKQSDLGLDNRYNYFLDFYLEDKKIDLEIDGNQHKERVEHDEKRDELLKNIGINVYRIKWKNINSNKGKKYIEDEINKFLEYYDNHSPMV